MLKAEFPRRQGRQPNRSYARIWTLPLVAQETGAHRARMSHTKTLICSSICAVAILVAKALGHSRIETTMRYDRRDKRAERKAQAQIDLPI